MPLPSLQKSQNYVYLCTYKNAPKNWPYVASYVGFELFIKKYTLNFNVLYQEEVYRLSIFCLFIFLLKKFYWTTNIIII